MLFPTIEEYKDAIRIAEHSLATLKEYEVVKTAAGEPRFSSGNFAVIPYLTYSGCWTGESRKTKRNLPIHCPGHIIPADFQDSNRQRGLECGGSVGLAVSIFQQQHQIK